MDGVFVYLKTTPKFSYESGFWTRAKMGFSGKKSLDALLERPDLRTWTGRELMAEFSSQRSQRLVLTRLIRGIIWQARGRILSGEEAPVGGNLRTFWYRFVKPVLARLDEDDAYTSDPYDRMLSCFTDLVLARGWMRYKDFDFTDENWSRRKIGVRRPEVLLVAEKSGWVRWLERQHEAHGISTLALGGAPSALTSEYTVEQLTEALGRPPRLHLLTVVDFDPSGALIAQALARQLHQVGAVVARRADLIHPRHYTPAQLAMFQFALPGGQPTKNQDWLDGGGGVGGGAYGLESESMPWATADEVVAAALDGQLDGHI